MSLLSSNTNVFSAIVALCVSSAACSVNAGPISNLALASDAGPVAPSNGSGAQDPALTGTWKTTNTLAYTQNDYASFSLSVVFTGNGEATVTTNGVRSATALAAGCTEVMSGTGTFTAKGGAVTAKIAPGNRELTACTDPTSNSSVALPDNYVGLINDALSGSYVASASTLSIVTASSGTMAYQKQ